MIFQGLKIMNTKVNATELRSACPGLFFYFGGAVIYALMKHLGDVIVHLGCLFDFVFSSGTFNVVMFLYLPIDCETSMIPWGVCRTY